MFVDTARGRFTTVAVVLCGSLTLPVAAAPTDPSTSADQRPTVGILVAYHSRTGNTQQMARAVARGARLVSGTHVVLKTVEQVTKEDLVAARGMILGCPTYYANIPGAMKVVIDDWSWKMKVDFTDKVGGAFATAGGQTGGKEHTVTSLLLFMINNRMIVAGPLYQDEEGEDIWAEIGASAATGPTDPGVGAHEIDAALRVGRRIARLAVKIHGAAAKQVTLP